MLTLQQILDSQSPLLNGKRVKLVRHKDERPEFRHLLKNRDTLLEYQKEQSKDRLKDCDYIVSFEGIERTQSVFLGIFRVDGFQIGENGKYYYDLTRIAEFEHLVDRLVIDWGKGTQAWLQWYDTNPKEVVEIRPEGFIGNFPGLLSFVLDYDKLKQMIHHPKGNFEWKHHLSAVNGVYLILDNSTGEQYVGSAYGGEGIWQRWRAYASDPSGGNKELKALIAKDPNYHRHFRFSILQTLPSNMTKDETVNIERLYKEKLGSRFHGLNWN